MIKISYEDLKIITDIRHNIRQHSDKSDKEYRRKIIRKYLERFKDIEIIKFPIK